MAEAARHRRFEIEPGIDNAVGFGGLAAEPEITGLHVRHLPGQHVRDRLASFVRLDVPGEGDQVAPVTIGHEQRLRRSDVRGGQGLLEPREPAAGALAGCVVAHPASLLESVIGGLMGGPPDHDKFKKRAIRGAGSQAPPIRAAACFPGPARANQRHAVTVTGVTPAAPPLRRHSAPQCRRASCAGRWSCAPRRAAAPPR